MLRFKTYDMIQEMAAVNVADLDMNFLNRAQKVTSFNLKPSDFQSTRYKAEIQHLFGRTFFPNFDLSQTLKGQPNMRKLNALIDQLKKENMRNYNRLHFYNLKGIGPGEATLYFLMDDADLGGGGSGGVDLIVKGTPYEIKASLVSKDGSLSGFKLGGTAPVGPIVTKLVEYKEQLGFKTQGKGQNEVNNNQMAAIKKKYPREYAKLEADFGRVAGKYFGNTPIIFINNNASDKIDPEDEAEKTRLLTATAGNIVAISKVQPRHIKMHVATQGTLKPKIKF
mgnify:CR=1 FL=1|tara:strand:- start:6592 stop:7434 length:843 start_codon:yes stop_codon:yes gene_type:complete